MELELRKMLQEIPIHHRLDSRFFCTEESAITTTAKIVKANPIGKNISREVLIIDFLGYVSPIAAFIFGRQI